MIYDWHWWLSVALVVGALEDIAAAIRRRK